MSIADIPARKGSKIQYRFFGSKEHSSVHAGGYEFKDNFICRKGMKKDLGLYSKMDIERA